jgi:uncharacterized protein (TIGR03435 family)
MSVRDLIVYAYSLKPYQISGAAAWISNDRFDIQAKAGGEAEPSKEQTREMVQSLLAGRFHLSFHRARRDIPVYALGVAKKGPKLKESGAPESFVRFISQRRPVLQLAVIKGTIAQLAELLSMYSVSFRIDGPPGRPIVDRTGLTGQYDFTLTWIPDDQIPPPGSDVLTLSSALQEQLGLRLEPANAPIETLVIDHAEKPDAN